MTTLSREQLQAHAQAWIDDWTRHDKLLELRHMQVRQEWMPAGGVDAS